MTKKLNTTTTGHDVDSQPYRPHSDPKVAVGPGPRLAGASDVYGALLDLRHEDREHFVAFDLNARHRVIARRIVHIGTLTGVEIHPREVFKPAIVNSACAIIVAHCHPSGDPSPSEADITLTERLRQVGEFLGIPVLDHVVFASEGYVSLAERNWRG
jgi:DNA repair protein RadC